ncbi:hypothetical protein [Albirhodobacter sp. R86504]|uniref:hypothetical protein n=1 Tax=Albirhodobacter sp. R86504 TaxID=3093848 RepID=UPI00366CAE7C
MQVVFHMGAHSSDEDRLIKCLKRNTEALEQVGTIVPWPGRYRMVLRDSLMALRGRAADAEYQEAILDSITDEDTFNRIVFSHDFFMCIPQRVVTSDGLYAMVPAKLTPLANILADAEVEFHMAMVNPATLIPALIARIKDATYDSVMQGIDPRALRWAPMVRKMAEAAQGKRLVVWCNEDTPLIWPELLRSLSGIGQDVELDGDFAILGAIMAPEGLERLRAYLTSHPPQTIAQRRKIVTAFLDKFAIEDRLEVEVPLPGWTSELIEEITQIYEADTAEIAQIDGVEFIAP